jgi:hypothetical protein
MVVSSFPHRISDRNLRGVVWLALVMLLAFYWVKFGYNAYLSAIFPGEIDYGEGIVWQEAALIPGPRMYGDLQNYPFIVFHYPPLYHLAVHALGALGVPWLMAGRILSTVCTAILAPLAAGIVLETIRQVHPDLSRHAVFVSALVAGLLLITFGPIHGWGYLMRVDMLAMVFELLGLFLALISVRRPSFTYPAALAFVLAVFTKQTMILGAIATFLVLVMRTPGRALRAALFAVLVGGLTFAVLTVATNGGFPRHIFLYNVDPFSWLRAYQLFTETVLTNYAVDLLIALIAAMTLLFVYRTRLLREAPVGYSLILLYFFLSMGSLVSLGKIGGDVNYFIPLLCSCALLIGFALAEAGYVAERNARSVPLLVLLGLLILQGLATPVFGDRRVVDPQVRRQYDELIALTRRASRPVFSEELTVLMQAGKEVPWEPFGWTPSARKTVYEQQAIGMIEAKAFAFAIVTTSLDNRERYSPAISDAFNKAYPVERHVGTMRLRMPLDLDNEQSNEGLPR